MATLSFRKDDVPFLLSGAGELKVDIAGLPLHQPLDESAPNPLSVAFTANATPNVLLGQDDTIKVAVSARTDAKLAPVFATSAAGPANILEANGLGNLLKNGNGDKVVLVFNADASGDAEGSGRFRYSGLSAGAELEAGVDARYSYLRALDKTLPIDRLLPEFFQSMRLPEQSGIGIQPGEAISLEYGGYLKLSAEAAAGYELSGTKSTALGALALSEHYGLSIIGTVGLKAEIAGRFSILVTGVDEMPGWARVRVRRVRSKTASIAADVAVGFNEQVDRFPPTPNEFLGAVLGVNAKSFLTVLDKAVSLSDFETFKSAIDGLAQRYVAEYSARSFDELENVPAFTSFLSRARQAVESYQEVGDRAVALFDRYFDHLADLTALLERIQSLKDEGLAFLRKDLNPDLWDMLSQLTDGDPLGFLLDQTTAGGKRVDALQELQARAASVLKLIREQAHDEIRQAITIAKQSFNIDQFLGALSRIDSVDALRSLASEKTGLFVTRMVGRTLDSSGNLKRAFQEIHACLDKMDAFKGKLFAAFKQSLSNSYSAALHAEYSRASESDDLVDAWINAAGDGGKALLKQAGKGDFEEILGAADADLVRLREGLFTHRTRRESAFKVHIVGWHLNYNYEGFDRVITETEQRLVPSDRGIVVWTTADVEVERARKRMGEQVHLNFLLRALGESAKAVKGDGRGAAYFVGALSSLTARYQLSFSDDDASAAELADYLAFAKDLGLDGQGATLEALAPLLPRQANGGFGAIETSYDVRFGERAVNALLSVTRLSEASEFAVRRFMRKMVLSNYLKNDSVHDVAFAYATDSVFRIFDDEGFAQFANHSQRVFDVQLPGLSIPAPSRVLLDHGKLLILTTLYSIENSMIGAIKDLLGVLHAGKAIDPNTFEKALFRFGGALKQFDSFDQTSSRSAVGTNTIFSLFDMLVRLASGGPAGSASVLRLKSQVNGRSVEKLFTAEAQEESA